MHTDNPDLTLSELSKLQTILDKFVVTGIEKLCRELLDDYFRENTSELSNENYGIYQRRYWN